MRQKSHFNLKRIAVAAYVATAVLFIAFALYMFVFKDNNVYSARDIASYKTVENYSEEEVEDASAPIGIRKKYSWQIVDIDNNESCLIFYIVHSYAEVRFDDELIYSITASENTRTGNSPSSNWVVVPLYPSDVGRKVTVTVTPVYKGVKNREIVFQIGSRYAVFMHRLKADLPQIILSALCIVMGVLLVIVQMCFVANKRTSSYDMLYLGVFSLTMGIWRITDTRFSSIMFENHAAALGYITLLALFVMAVPLLLFMDERHTGKFRVLLRSAALVNCAGAMFSLVCQAACVAELRQTLPVCHIMLIIDIAALLIVSVFDSVKGVKEKHTLIFNILIALGVLSDIIYYYRKATSSGTLFTTIAFLIYTVYLFAENILDIINKVYYDVNTKLYNKAHWEEFIKDKIPDSEPIGVMMLDLNRLKYTNDTFGHEMGDKMIVKFSEIMRKTFASHEFLCRWGGDEFVVVVRNANLEKMENYDKAIHAAVENYNKSGAKPEIYFACGYALSTEFADISRDELLTKADKRMYSDKQQWYNEHVVTK
jgi:diguanylate cyclase (GGDEF)-like protein